MPETLPSNDDSQDYADGKDERQNDRYLVYRLVDSTPSSVYLAATTKASSQACPPLLYQDKKHQQQRRC